MKEIERTSEFNILHSCDYHAPYADLSAYLDYPGHVVNLNPRLTTRRLSWKELAGAFERPCMGGLDRHGVIVTGARDDIRREVEGVLRETSGPFILGADCTLPDDTNWDNIRIAISAAHGFSREDFVRLDRMFG